MREGEFDDVAEDYGRAVGGDFDDVVGGVGMGLGEVGDYDFVDAGGGAESSLFVAGTAWLKPRPFKSVGAGIAMVSVGAELCSAGQPGAVPYVSLGRASAVTRAGAPAPHGSIKIAALGSGGLQVAV